MIKGGEEVLYALREFGVLRRSQILSLLYRHSPASAERTLLWLTKSGYVFEAEGYIMASPRLKPEERVITAFEIMLQFIKRISNHSYFSASSPSQVFFQIGDRDYEIAVIYGGEDYLLSSLASSNVGSRETTYIIGLNDESMIPRIPTLKGKTVFAVFDSDLTEFRFYEHSTNIEIKMSEE